MADTKLSELTELAATPAGDDEVYIRDVSEEPATESKRITVTNLMAAASGGPTIVRKTADETVNNSNTLQSDNHLLLALGANEVWQIDIFLLITGAVAAAFKSGFSYPVNCSIFWGCVGAGGVAVTTTWGHTPAGQQPNLLEEAESLGYGVRADARTVGYRLSLIVINGANAGNVNLQWAQNTADVSDTKLLENSCLIAHQLL